MTRRVGWTWLVVAALSGTALAQSPPPGASPRSPAPAVQCPQVSPPLPSYPAASAVSPGPASPCTASSSSWRLRVERGQLYLETVGGIAATFEKLTMAIPGVEPIEVSADQQVHLHSLYRSGCRQEAGGCRLEAAAEQVSRSGPGGVVLKLEGKAKLTWARHGHHAEVRADRIILNLATGHIASEMFPCPPAEVPVVQPCATDPVAPPPLRTNSPAP